MSAARGATQQPTIQSARRALEGEKREPDRGGDDRQLAPVPKKKRKKKHGVSVNLSGTRYDVSKYNNNTISGMIPEQDLVLFLSKTKSFTCYMLLSECMDTIN